MQRGGVGENCNGSDRPFDGFGGEDPFDDPFFTRPFGMFSSRSESGSLQHTNGSKQLIIEEVESDIADEMVEDKEDDVTNAACPNRNPLIEHPEDQDEESERSNSSNRNESFHSTDHHNPEGMEPRAQSVSFKRVTYGGISGAYYTATTTRQSWDDGVAVEESTQANRTTGQATHRLSRGIHDKGHSVTRKLNSDGKVDTVQTLHNLNEDELTGFEQDQRIRHFQGWNGPFDFTRNSGPLIDWERFSDPWRNTSLRNGWPSSVNSSFQEQSSSRKPRKVARINIE